jgi:lipid II:glycine glycyltransferase (peptidoglycan interpeptide bridge formation enzyme)
MHPKNRYNIRLAENKGVVIEIIENNFEKYFEDFYNLMERTAKRNNFKLHPKVYYKNIFENCEENKNAFLILAKHGDKILAISLILLFGETAYFVFGGSSDEYKNLMAPHLSHWQGIIEAKNRGYKFYNFGAVSSGSSYKEFEGISIFKKRFGGQPLEYSDSYDLILKPIWYRLYNLRKWALNQK